MTLSFNCQVDHEELKNINLTIKNNDIPLYDQILFSLASSNQLNEIERTMFYIKNTKTDNFILDYKEIESVIKSSPESLIIVNCSVLAQKIITILDKFASYLSEKPEDLINSNNNNNKKTNNTKNTTNGYTTNINLEEIKSISFRLSNYFSIDIFAEEFISYGGVKILVDTIAKTSGNLRAYSLKAFKRLIQYLNAFEYIKENSIILEDLYTMMMKNKDVINNVNYTLEILCLICEIMKDEGVKMIIKADESYSKKNNLKPFENLLEMITDKSTDIQVFCLRLITNLIKFSSNSKDQSVLLCRLNESGLHYKLDAISTNKFKEIQDYLTVYQKLTGEILNLSEFQFEYVSRKCKELEFYCSIIS